MSDQDLIKIAPTLSRSEQEALVLRFWRRGDLTPLPLANALARRDAGAPRPVAGAAQRMHFGMRFSGTLVESFTHHHAIAHHHAAYARIRLRGMATTLRQSQRARHVPGGGFRTRHPS